MQQTAFYVYEHIRSDTKAVFYVGKGSERRVKRSSSRSSLWFDVVKEANGFEYRFVAQNLDEELAYFVEEERIDQLRRLGVKLINVANGGAGSRGVKHSQEVIKRMSEAKKGKPKNELQRNILAAGRSKAINKKATCPHCGKHGSYMAMCRWHFDNCKEKA